MYYLRLIVSKLNFDLRTNLRADRVNSRFFYFILFLFFYFGVKTSRILNSVPLNSIPHSQLGARGEFAGRRWEFKII